MENGRPIRVLHQLAQMSRGGLETWLMYILRHLDRTQVQFDFCVSVDHPCDYDDEVRELGGRIIPCIWNRSLPRFCKEFSRVLRADPYDVVHAHTHYFAGIPLYLAAKEGIPVRLAHAHSAGDGQKTTLPRSVYRRGMRRVVERYSTGILGCSKEAITNFLGYPWDSNPKSKVAYYGIEMKGMDDEPNPAGVRTEFAIPVDAPLLIHVGRFDPAKNHMGLIDILAKALEHRPEIRLLLVGGGDLRSVVEERVRERGLSHAVRFAGVRSDIARLMKAADLLVMPSIREGMPVTVLEAASVGLRMVVSDRPGIREALDLVGEGVLLDVRLPTQQWAQAIIDSLKKPEIDRTAAFAEFCNSPFTAEASAADMQEYLLSRFKGAPHELIH